MNKNHHAIALGPHARGQACRPSIRCELCPGDPDDSQMPLGMARQTCFPLLDLNSLTFDMTPVLRGSESDMPAFQVPQVVTCPRSSRHQTRQDRRAALGKNPCSS